MATATKIAKEIITYIDDVGNIIVTVTRNVPGDMTPAFMDTFAAGTTNVTVPAIIFTKARVQYFVFTSDQPVTIKTNSATSPQETITLTAGGAYAWNTGHPEADPLVGDINGVFVTNAGTALATVKIYTLINATP